MLFMAFIRSSLALSGFGTENGYDSVPSLNRFPRCECQLQITVSPLLQCEMAPGAPGSSCHNTAAIFDTATGSS